MEEIFKRLGITLDFEFAIVYFSLLWIRMLTIATIIPFLFGRPVPKKVVVGASMVLVLFLYPLLKPADPSAVVPDDKLILFALYLKEAFVGLCLGLAVSMMFYGFDAAGRIIDNQRGASLARVLIPQLGQQGSISGQLLFQLSVVVYLVLGGHLLFFKSVFESYRLIPIFEFPHVEPGLFPMMDFFIVISGKVIMMAVQIAAPVIIAILVTDLVLGLTNRLAPQINVWELGFNIRGFAGVLALWAAFMYVGRNIYNNTAATIHNTDTVIELFQGSIPPELKEVKTPPELKNIFTFEPTGESIAPPGEWDKTIRVIKPEGGSLPQNPKSQIPDSKQAPNPNPK